MCGVTGFWGPRDRDLLEAMTRVLLHRGPDDEGYFEADCASLGHRRLSIIDLEHGHQPMASEEGRLQVVYNGEIYNYRELRAELAARGHRFVTDSDSEVLLHAYQEYGPDCFTRFNGMWAVAILDLRGERPRLALARDHFGIKPLYWARCGQRLLFASEIKAILQDPAFVAEPNDQRIYEYLLLGLHDHDAETFFRGVRAVPAATCLLVDEQGVRERRYWEPRLAAGASPDPAELRRLFERAIERRLVADVPVGTCLSGGLDSSSIVCVMSGLLRAHVPDARSLGDRLKTFSAVFDNDPIDERAYIEPVLQATGAERNFVAPSSQQFVEELERFLWHQEEPMVSTGPYAQWCVMRLAAPKVKVLLDGQAGDELLAGYVPYQYVYLRQLLRERRYRDLLTEAWAARDVLLPLVRRRLAERRRALRVGRLLRPEFARAMRRPRDARSRDNLKLRLLQDLLTYSLPPLLRYEDRSSMAHSMESRVPFLDQELVEWALRLPPEAIIRGGWSRWILREGMRGVLPEKIRRRRWKVGFTTPEFRWLKARRAVFHGLLRSPAFAARNYWDGPAIAEAFRAACDGQLEESPFFWRAINVELWLRVFFEGTDLPDRQASRPSSADGGDAARPAFQRTGDQAAARLADTEMAAHALAEFRPNAGRHLFAAGPDGRAIYARAPVRTRVLQGGDDLESAVHEGLAALDDGVRLRPGDLLAISEKAVAVCQRRSFPVQEVRPGRLAHALSRFVRRTPIGIGLGIPATMQLAIEQAGAPRIMLAAAAAAAARPLGLRGVFYRVAGHDVNAIDGPTAGTLPPYDTHAKLPPADPAGVAGGLARSLSEWAGGAVEVAIIDANDLGANVLGASDGVDRGLLVWLLRDNPLGQGSEQTPVALIRRVDRE